MNIDDTLIVTLVRSENDKIHAWMLMESLRRFGGLLGQCAVCCFETDPGLETQKMLADLPVQVLPLKVTDSIKDFLFSDKVFACAQVESMVGSSVKTLLWMDPGFLIIKPPLLYDLDPPYDAALRPVHIQNIGLPETEKLDPFWQKIYQAVGLRDARFLVETFVEEKPIRAYFNTHAFAVNPAKGLMKKWLDCFEEMVSDAEFQTKYCSDGPHRVFLHQAILSALLTKHITLDCIRILPPEYNYPYNLQGEIPEKKRAKALNDLVSITTEKRLLDPENVSDIKIQEPFKTWLKDQFKSFSRATGDANDQK